MWCSCWGCLKWARISWHSLYYCSPFLFTPLHASCIWLLKPCLLGRIWAHGYFFCLCYIYRHGYVVIGNGKLCHCAPIIRASHVHVIQTTTSIRHIVWRLYPVTKSNFCAKTTSATSCESRKLEYIYKEVWNDFNQIVYKLLACSDSDYSVSYIFLVIDVISISSFPVYI